jgi:RNA-directed DNA polymerase
MRESDTEGVATHGGPESCVGVREGAGEALTGYVQAGLLSHEIKGCGVPTSLSEAEGNIAASVFASCWRTPRAGEAPSGLR